MWHLGWMMRKKRGLRMIVFSLLSESPKNGAELIEEIEELTHGWWRPSPGSIYPLLEQLSSEGMLKRAEDGRYQLTSRAEEELGWSFGPMYRKQRTVVDVVNELNGFVSLIEDINRSDRKKLEPYLSTLNEIARRLLATSERSG